MSCPALAEDLSDLFPILEPGGSDSACFDNAMELLVRAGRSSPHALMMMIPEAFGPQYHISTDKRAFYEYHAAIMEPWDGPAAMVFTDGRLVGGTLDRNGLRPCRYVVTTDGLVVLASEVGRDRVPAGARSSRRAGFSPAGCSWSIPQRGPDHRRQRDQGQDRPAEALSPLAGGEPHRAARAVPAGRSRGRAIRRRSPSGCGPSATRAKSCRLIVAPMAANGQEPVGSMGTDTPLAVLSDAAEAAVQLFQAALRPGHQPADRPACAKGW